MKETEVAPLAAPGTPDPQDRQDAPETLTILDLDSRELLEVDANGEIVSVHGAPDSAAEIREIADWAGPKLVKWRAELSGIEAEEKAALDEIKQHYGRLRKKVECKIGWVRGQYGERLKAYAREALAGARTKTTRVGMLTLSFRTNPGRWAVGDLKAAITWAKLSCPAAVRVNEEFLISMIPKETVASWDPQKPSGANGLVFVEPTEVFEVH